MMTLKEAIEHATEISETCDNKECSLDHKQLACWLTELKELREQHKSDMMNIPFCAEENKRLLALSCVIADLKIDNTELKQLVRHLTDDYNKIECQLNVLKKRNDEDQLKQTMEEMSQMRKLYDKLELENEQLKTYVIAIDSFMEEKNLYIPKGKSCVYMQNHPAVGSQSCLECTSCLRFLDDYGVICNQVLEDTVIEK